MDIKLDRYCVTGDYAPEMHNQSYFKDVHSTYENNMHEGEEPSLLQRD